MLENLRISLQGIWLHKLRAFLTMLGIIIGIASIISIVSTIKGTNEQIKENLIGSGNNAVRVSLYQSDYESEGGTDSAYMSIKPVTQEQLDEINELDEVESTSTFYARSYADGITYNATYLSGAQIFGVDQNYFSVAGYQLMQGRSFVDSDYEQHKKVVLIDKNVESVLFSGESGLDKTIDIKGEPFVIVGILEEQRNSNLAIESVEDYYAYAYDNSGVVLMPKTSWPIVYQYDEVENVLVKATSTDDMSRAGNKTAEILNQNITDAARSAELSYKAEDLLETVRSLQQLSESTNFQLLWIASIALLVGGIGVMNIMLVSVTERTREIGLKKAIGAKNKEIRAQFLTEAAVLSSLGGFFGVIVGIIMSQVISRVSGTPTAISVPATVGAVAFSMLIGILFGLVPSIKASKLNPIEALRRQ